MDGSEAQSSAEESRWSSDGDCVSSAAASSGDNNMGADSSDVASSSALAEGNPADGDDRNAPSTGDPESSQHTSSEWSGESSADAHSEDIATDEGKGRKKGDKGSSTKLSFITDESSNNANSSENQSSTGLETTTGDESQSSHQNTTARDDQWTTSEDGILRGMKEGDGNGATWVEIASALGKSKNQVKSRWRVIKNQQPPASTEETTEAGETTDPEQATGAETTSGMDQTDGNVSPLEDQDKDNNAGGQTPDLKGEMDNNKFQKKSKIAVVEETSKDGQNDKGEEWKGKRKLKNKNKVVNNRWPKGVRNNKIAAENKQVRSRAHKSLEPALSGEEASSESESASESSPESSSLSDFGYGDPEWRRQMRYLQDHMYATLYPPEIRPEPDAHFSARDCRLLAMLDSKQRRSRWLTVQADFYNITGRMVPLDVLRDKCKSAGRVEKKRINIEEWMNDVPQQSQGKTSS